MEKKKFFFDTEFIEGYKDLYFSKRKERILDLISIGIVSETGEEYYAISNEFDLDYVWNNKDQWVKENVLKPIYFEMYQKLSPYVKSHHPNLFPFTKAGIKELLKNYGKTKNQIKKEVLDFLGFYNPFFDPFLPKETPIELWAYYSHYDWVVFCSLFGRMIDLPKGMPMFCMDIKQLMEIERLTKEWKQEVHPDPEGEHNALVDAKWNKKLYEKIISATRLV